MVLERRCFRDPWTRRMYLVDMTENELATYLVVRRTVEDEKRKTKNENGEARAARSKNLQSEIRNPKSEILAYGGFWLMADEAHIATVASHPDWRGCGLGEWLTVALLEAAIARGARLATLEVRAGNTPAQQLYRKLGFEVEGVRAHYYRDGEDGLIMTTPPLADPVMQARLAAARADARARLEKCLSLTRESSL
ncbi:MAG: GNAT family N-acetyltransferase [Chloroflexi bacterium]|nr:GNAT family N-acetyltransferase [Chloroflexota bacterium]